MHLNVVKINIVQFQNLKKGYFIFLKEAFEVPFHINTGISKSFLNTSRFTPNAYLI